MAREKKKESALTPEEKLEQALVPDWEQPYKVPKNWCWIKAGYMVTLYRGVSYKKEDAHTEKGENDCLIMRGSNILEGKIDTETDNVYVDKSLVSEEQLVKKHDIVIVSSTGSTKVIGRAGVSALDYDDVAFGAFLTLLRPLDCASKAFVDCYFQSDLYRERIRSLASGVNINNIRAEYITESPMPFPPLAEQQRIVDCVESLFAKLDEAKEKAQSVLDSFEPRKAAILRKAFAGELTATWRAEHDVEMDSWRYSRFDAVAEIKSNLVDPADYKDYPHIAPDNIEKKTGVLLGYHTIAEDGVTSVKHRFYPGQILYSKIRPYLSKLIVVDFEGLCSADMYPINAKENARCLWYYMLSEEFLEQASFAGSRSVLPKINKKELSDLTVYLPSNLDEQQEIVRILDSLFAKEQQAEEVAEAMLEKIELLKKSILARAFRGELGTNDPAAESAVELIKQVLSAKIPDDKPAKKRTKKQPEVTSVAKTIMQALSVGAKMTPEKLKADTGLRIDDFYDQLKALIDSGRVVETRIDRESYLEAKNEDRQPDN